MITLRLLDVGGGRSGDPGALRDLLRASGIGGGKGRVRCPDCDGQWTERACLSCHRWSRHEAWYEPAGEPGSPA